MTSMLQSAAGNGSQGTDQVAQAMGQIRQVASAVDDLGASNPAFAPFVQQIKTILRQMIIQSAQSASVQTPSSEAVPTAGG